MSLPRTLSAFLLTSLAFGGGLLTGTSAVRQAAAAGDPYGGFATLARALTTIEGSYVEEVETRGLVYGALDGMADSLDAHTVFMAPDTYGDLQERTEGQFAGIGVEFRGTEAGAQVDRVIVGSPAALGGIEAGDRITAVEGTPTPGLSSSAVARLLSGEPGTKVRLELERAGEVRSLSLVRDRIREPAVEAELFEPGLGYLRLVHFQREAATEVGLALVALDAEGGEPLKGLVLDLRENTGGLLEEAFGIVDLFLAEGLVVETRTRGGVVEERLEATGRGTRLDLPLVVLIDGGSASASEIVAGSLQAQGRARLVGSPSYGKGSVQRIFEFEDGAALKLTVARYALEGGRTIADGVGLEPDILVAGAPARSGLGGRLEAELQRLELPAEERVELELIAAELRAREPEGAVVWAGGLDARLVEDDQLRAARQALAP